jgi:hypothetical protein
VVEVHGCGGIAPHDVSLMADGHHLAVANYGSTLWPEDQTAKPIPYPIEPSLTVVDLRDGRLVHEVRVPDRRLELRHLAAHSPSRVFAIQTRTVEVGERTEFLAGTAEVMGADLTIYEGAAYAPAPLLKFDLTGQPASVRAALPERVIRFRQGQTIVYDPIHDEAIATFTSGHAIAVMDGASGRLKRVIRTDRLGLHNPRGVAFHPNGSHYAVSGSWRDIYLFRRGSHELDRDRCWYETLYDHSHMSIA